MPSRSIANGNENELGAKIFNFNYQISIYKSRYL